MKKLLTLITAALGAALLSGCIDSSSSSDSSSSDRATMCYTISGNTMTVNCNYDSLGTCAEDGKIALGSYDTWDACWADTDTVLNNYGNGGGISPGPNSYEGGGNTGDTSNTGGDGSTSGGSGSYDWSYTCPGGYGGGGTLPIPVGSCEAEYKNYGQVFGCNDVANMYSACRDLYSCLGDNNGLSSCEYYSGY